MKSRDRHRTVYGYGRTFTVLIRCQPHRSRTVPVARQPGTGTVRVRYGRIRVRYGIYGTFFFLNNQLFNSFHIGKCRRRRRVSAACAPAPPAPSASHRRRRPPTCAPAAPPAAHHRRRVSAACAAAHLFCLCHPLGAGPARAESHAGCADLAGAGLVRMGFAGGAGVGRTGHGIGGGSRGPGARVWRARAGAG